MNPDERKMLKENLELSQENNEMLRAIRRSMFWGGVIKAIYWILIIGVAIGAFYFLQPYMDTFAKAYSDIKANFNNVGSLFNK